MVIVLACITDLIDMITYDIITLNFPYSRKASELRDLPLAFLQQ